MINLKCEGCGCEETLPSPAVAFALGWDCPPFFSQVITCPNCSSAEVMIKEKQEGDNEKFFAE